MNDIDTLRETLFDTLRKLQDKEAPLDIDRAKAINETAQVIINTVKVEADFARSSGLAVASRFLPAIPAPEGRQKTATGTQVVKQLPGGTVTTHSLR